MDFAAEEARNITYYLSELKFLEQSIETQLKICQYDYNVYSLVMRMQEVANEFTLAVCQLGNEVMHFQKKIAGYCAKIKGSQLAMAISNTNNIINLLPTNNQIETWQSTQTAYSSEVYRPEASTDTMYNSQWHLDQAISSTERDANGANYPAGFCPPATDTEYMISENVPSTVNFQAPSHNSDGANGWPTVQVRPVHRCFCQS